MKKWMNRTLAFMLASAMMLSNMEAVVYAAEPGSAQTTEQDAAQESSDTAGQEPEEENVPETPEDASQDSDAKQDESAAGESEDENQDNGDTDESVEELPDETGDGTDVGEAEEGTETEVLQPEENDEDSAEELAPEENTLEDGINADAELMAAAGISAAASFSGGSGTAEDPYLIGTAEELKLFNDMQASDISACFKLTANIDMRYEQWKFYPSVFSGTFDGNNKKISNLLMVIKAEGDTVRDNYGFICNNKGTIKNLTIQNVKRKMLDFDGLGIFCGVNEGTITNCTFSGTFKDIDDSVHEIEDLGWYLDNGVAGICRMLKSGEITNCTNTVSISGDKEIAGIVVAAESGIIANCRNTGNLTGYLKESTLWGSYVAGICLNALGDPYNPRPLTIKNCTNTGTIKAADEAAGIVYRFECPGNTKFCLEGCDNSGSIYSAANLAGIVVDAAGNAEISYCTNSGAISDIVGLNRGGGSCGGICRGTCNVGADKPVIKNCYNTGTITANKADIAGGIVGELVNAAVSNCYNAGNIVCQNGDNMTGSYCGGIAAYIRVAHSDGSDSSCTEITDCYNTGKITANNRGEHQDMLGGIFGQVNILDFDNATAADIVKVRRCYNAGTVTYLSKDGSKGGIGGIIRVVSCTLDIGDCYYLNNVSDAIGQNEYTSFDASVLKKCSSSELQDKATFVGWDFENVWKMGQGTYKYPVLKGLSAGALDADIAEPEQSEYTVTFVSQTETTPLEVPVSAGNKVPRPSEPTRTGYAFLGWYTEDSCINLWDFENGTVWMNMTLFAGWEAADELDTQPAEEDIAAGVADTFWVAKIPSYTFTGAAIKPTVQVYAGIRRLKAGTDYTVTYKNNTNAGTATVTVKGKGTYKKCPTLTTTFEIKSRRIDDTLIDKTFTNAYATVKNNKNPALKFTAKYGKKTLKNKKDYTLKVYDQSGTDEMLSWGTPGTYCIKLEGLGNYTGTYTTQFVVIRGIPVSKLSVSKIPAQNYDGGTAIKPAITIKYGKVVLTENEDYTLSYRNNTEIGTATVVITGKGEYRGTRRMTFSINGIQMKKVKFTDFVSSMEYNGKKQTQNAKLTYQGTPLVEGTDYTVAAYLSNRDAGKATVLYKGMGKYGGTVKKTYKIKVRSLKSLDLERDVTLSGSMSAGAMPNVVIYDTQNAYTLIQGVDYTVQYQNTVGSAVGSSAKITITGKGNFNQKIVKTYTITE